MAVLFDLDDTLVAVGLSQAQAFVNGNKRTAFIAADVLLRANGHLFVGDPLEMARQLEGVATRGKGEEEGIASFTAWLRGQVVCQ